MNRNLPPLTKILAKGPEAGMEFERLIKKLLLHDGKRHGYIFEPGATYGDFGCDGWVKNNYPGADNPVLFQIKWLQSGLEEWFNVNPIKESLKRALSRRDKIPFSTYILITPNDLTQKEKDLLKALPERYNAQFNIFHFGHTEILELLDHYPALLKYYYGAAADNVPVAFNILKDRYSQAVAEDHKYIDFIGMPTGSYQEQQLLRRPEMAQIYIPLGFLRPKTPLFIRTVDYIMNKYKRVVVLGDPGSGKSTLAKHLAILPSRDKKYSEFLPMIIPIRDLQRKKQERNGECSIIEYLQHVAVNSYQLEGMQKDFFIAMLEMGKGIVVFDGLDEIASEAGRQRVMKDIRQFSLLYPDSRVWITSRIVGYTASVQLEKNEFQHYYLAPVSLDQAKDFIRRWYEIQMQGRKDRREDCIAALQRAVEENRGVLRLRENPLLLTMMTLIHQFEGSLPEDRARLYQGCIKLLLETWQEIKLQALGVKSPLAERGLRYEEQVRLLAAAAYYIQEKNQHVEKEDTRGLIRESELAKVLFEARYNKRRMTEEEAREDIKVFLDYVRDRSGLLIERGRDKNRENLFSFVHLSFMEYLCAWRLAEDKSKSQQDRIRELLPRLGSPTWEEPLLLTLYLLSSSSANEPFLDEFCGAAFQYLEKHPNDEAWLLLGRGARDNLDLADDDIRRICRELCALWTPGDTGKSVKAEKVLREIVTFSKEGKKRLEEIIREEIQHRTAPEAFSFIKLYQELFNLDSLPEACVLGNPDWTRLGSYLPSLKHSGKKWAALLKMLTPGQWRLFFGDRWDSVEQITDMMRCGQANNHVCAGYVAETWRTIVSVFENRRRFVKNNKDNPEVIEKAFIKVYFGEMASAEHPLEWTKPFEDLVRLDIGSLNTDPPIFPADDFYSINTRFFNRWFEEQILKKCALMGAELTPEKRYVLKTAIENKSVISSRLPITGLRNFSRLIEIPAGNLHRDFSRMFISKIKHTFNDFRDHQITGELCQVFCRWLTPGFRFKNNPEIMKFLRNAIPQPDGVSSDMNFDSKKAAHIISQRLEKGDKELAMAVAESLIHETIKDKISIEYKLKKETSQENAQDNFPSISFMTEKKEPFLLAMLWDYMEIILDIHYQHLLLAWISSIATTDLSEFNDQLGGMARAFVRVLHFNHYFLNFTWNYYSEEFNATVDLTNSANAGLLAAFVSSAARTTLVAHQPCRGEAWEKTLAAAETSQDLRVQIALAFYKLCIHQNPNTNGDKLQMLLKRLKAEDPEFFTLTGFVLRGE